MSTTTEETTDSYDSMTKADLQAEAEARGLDVASDATKQDLIDELRADDGDGEAAEALPAGDVAAIDPGSGEGEVGPIILAGYWVQLGEGEDVPEEYVGHFAVVLESPWNPAPIGVSQSEIAGYIYDEEKKYLVRTRDQYNATFEVDEDSISSSAQNRVELQPYG